jgi:hypothetical protein
MMQEIYNQITAKCFQKCIGKPGDRLDKEEQKCLAKCVDRYLDSREVQSRHPVAHACAELPAVSDNARGAACVCAADPCACTTACRPRLRTLRGGALSLFARLPVALVRRFVAGPPGCYLDDGGGGRAPGQMRRVLRLQPETPSSCHSLRDGG